MSVLAHQALTRMVHSSCFELAGQLCVPKVSVEKHLNEFLKSSGHKPSESRLLLQDVFSQACFPFVYIVNTCPFELSPSVEYGCSHIAILWL